MPYINKACREGLHFELTGIPGVAPKFARKAWIVEMID
jgi:hypothetical protein